MRSSHRSPPTPRSGDGSHRALVLVGLLGTFACAPFAHGQSTVDDAPIRVRIAYGADEPVAWRGEARAEGAELEGLRALPVDPDPFGGAWPAGGELEIAHAVPTPRGAFDVTLSRREGATLSVRIATPDSTTSVEATFSARDLAAGAPLVERGPGGMRIVAERLADDRLPIRHERDELIFDPGETFRFEAVADPPGVEPGTAYEFGAELRDAANDRVVWSAPPLRVDAPVAGLASLPVEIPLPTAEGVYRVSLRVTRPSGFTTRFRVGGSTKTLASRDFNVVVFDRRATPGRLGEWRETYAFDPASPTWRDRLPAWTGWRRLPWIDAGTFGSRNGRSAPPVRDGFVEIPSSGDGGAHWQAYPLAVPAAGKPVLLEIQFPDDQPQQLGLTLFDATAEGGLAPVGAGVVTETPRWGQSSEPRVARLVCWPRTEGPLLVVHNPSTDRPARFGRVRVLQSERAAAEPTDDPTRVLLDFDDPSFGRFVGLDRGRTIDSPLGALTAAKRLADLVHSAGANGAVVTVNRGAVSIDDGSLLGRAARDGNGGWGSGADDLPRLSPLELLHRVFDRRGLSLTPAIDFDAVPPTAVRESLRRDESLAAPPSNTALDPLVRSAMVAATQRLQSQSQEHRSFAGVAVRVGADSALATPHEDRGLDAATVDRFLSSQGLRWPDGVPRGPTEHAAAIRENLDEEWKAWRREQLTAFYDEATTRLGSRPLLLGRGLHTLPRLQAATTPRLGREGLASDALEGLGVAALPLAYPTVATLGLPLDRHASQATASTLLRKATQTEPAPAYTTATTRAARLRDAARWFGGATTVRCVETPADGAAHSLTSALADGAGSAIVDGGAATVGWQNDNAVRLRELLRRRCGGTETSTATAEGVRVFTKRKGDDTLLYAVNASPWPTRGEVALKTDQRSLVTPLDDEGGGTPWAEGDGKLPLALGPHEAKAWRFRGADAAVEYVYAVPDDSAKTEVAERLADFQNRDRTARRPAALIENPSFEEVSPRGEAIGWRAVRGVAVPVTATAREGDRCLSLASRSDAAVLWSSPIASPETGQLAVTLAARPVKLGEASVLRIALEQEDGDYAVHTTVPAENLAVTDPAGDASGWRELVFAVDDLPLGDGPPLRLRVSIEGAGEVLLDDVRTETLKLPLASYAEDLQAEQLALVRLERDAEQAFAEQRLSDCREILDSYWARFVTEYFPPKSEVAETPEQSASVADEAPPQEEEETEVADRWRRYLPSFLR